MQLARSFGRNSNVFTSKFPIGDEVIREVAPSIFAETPHESRSSKYVQIPTYPILQALRKAEFEVFMVCQSRSRIEGKENFTKHMLRLRHRSCSTGLDGGAFEIIFLNSHDGTSSYQLLSGWLEFVCQNGMVSGDISHDFRIKHAGRFDTVRDSVIDGAFTVLEDAPRLADERQELRGITLTPREQEVFARAAIDFRWSPDEESGNSTAPIEVSQVLTPRRRADAGNSAWEVLNRTQESLVRGGLSGRNATGRSLTTRAVTGIDQNVKLNRALWQLAQGMAALKTEGVEVFTEALKTAA